MRSWLHDYPDLFEGIEIHGQLDSRDGAEPVLGLGIDDLADEDVFGENAA